MTQICKLIDALLYVLVAVVSLLLNVLTGGSGREFFSYRAYRKAMIDGGKWVWAMNAVDALFRYLPQWSGFRTPNHCKDVADNAEAEAARVIGTAQTIREMAAFRSRK